MHTPSRKADGGMERRASRASGRLLSLDITRCFESGGVTVVGFPLECMLSPQGQAHACKLARLILHGPTYCLYKR